MTTLYLVRHGETDLNKEHIIQSSNDTHLNMKGVNKVKQLRTTLLSLGVDVCYTSPLFRTLETAFGLVGDKALIINDERLMDRAMGIYEGKKCDEFDHQKYWDYNLNCSDDGVESIHDMFIRGEKFVNEILQKHNGKKVLIVSHTGMIRVLHHILKNTDLKKEQLRFEVPNCYFEKIDLNKEKQ
ncbi:MAG: histidine phosphatase family protein [Bacilli bacterium]|nr:histidine phosphatase family protein [Bacilli bacterium]